MKIKGLFNQLRNIQVNLFEFHEKVKIDYKTYKYKQGFVDNKYLVGR